MKNMKFWRTALVAALVLTVMLSVTGGTIAWFTDSVTSEVNTITAGNLDIELYKGTVAEANKVTAETPVFELPELWEPGAVAYENLVLKNEGTLHLHYTFGLNYFGENYVVVDGNTTEYSLANALKVALVENGVSGTREEVIAQAANLTALSAGEIKGSMEPGETKTYGVVIYWQPGPDDNNWNVNNGKTVTPFNEQEATALNINLGVKLDATQVEAESDSFGNDYDADAKFAVSTADELADALEKGGRIVLANDIELTNRLNIPADVEAVLDLAGNKLTAPASTYGLRNYGDLTITGNGEIVGDFGAISSFGGTLTVENGTFKASGVSGTTHHCVYAGSGANIVINGGTFEHSGAGTSDSGSVLTANDYDGDDSTSATITVNGGVFIGSGSYIKCIGDFNSGNDTVIVNGGIFSTDPTMFVAEGNIVENVNGKYVVVAEGTNIVASSAELATAIADDSTDQKVVLMSGDYQIDANITNDDLTKTSMEIPEGEEVTLDLNEKVLTYSVEGAPSMENNGTLTIKNGTLNNGAIAHANGAHVILNTGKLTIENGNYGVDEEGGSAVRNVGGEVIINGGTFASCDRSWDKYGNYTDASSYRYAYVFVNMGGSMTINDATVECNPHGMFSAQNGAKLVVNGGNFKMEGNGTTYYMLYITNGSTVELNGGTYYWTYGDTTTPVYKSSDSTLTISESCVRQGHNNWINYGN